MCGFLINGVAHGGHRGTTVCQLSMRFFKDGDSLTLEPWRAKAFPVLRDLAVDRSAFDRIIQAGGFISAPTGVAPGRERHPRSQGRRGPRDGRGGLHRMRGLRGRVSQRGSHAVYGREDHASQFASARAAAALPANGEHGRGDVRGTFRKLHESWRVRGRVPQEDSDRVYRTDEPRPDSRHVASPRRVRPQIRLRGTIIYFCHSERSEESLLGLSSMKSNERFLAPAPE